MKIRILGRGFQTTHYGFLEAGSVHEVDPVFGGYAVDKMKAAELVAAEKAAPKKKAAKK